jgi:hypothetical protein
MSYRIGSLNLLKSNRTESQGRIFHGFIYEMIADEGLDIVAFQEARGEKVIDGIRCDLPSCWKGDRVYGSEFSFIWNSHRVEECSKARAPQVFSSYKADTHMMREPLYGRFSPSVLDPSIELRLIDIHIVHGGNNMAVTFDRRKAECGLSKGEIHRTIDVHRYGNFKRAFTVVLGDYNLDCGECNLCGPENVRTLQTEKTTLKTKEQDYHNSYDHFSFDVEKNSSVPYTVSRIDAVNRYFNGDFTSYRENVSDHVPIKLEIF